MTDKILIDLSVVEKALTTLEGWGNYDKWVWPESALFTAKKNTAEMITALRAALEQPQVEQPVAWIEHEWSGSGLRHLHFERPAPTVRDEVVCPVWTPLYTHSQNLNCKSTQARLATLWGYEKPQPPRQPLTDAEILMVLDAADIPDLPRDFKDVDIDIARAIEAAHGIGESNA